MAMLDVDLGLLQQTDPTFFSSIQQLSSDRPRKRVSAVIFHARSFDGDDDGLFELAADLTSPGGVSENLVVINGGNGRGFVAGVSAWPGKGYYEQRLRKLHCNVAIADEGLHTRAEAIAFNKLAEQVGIKRAIVIGQPFHLPRILLSHLRVMAQDENNYPMQIYCATPEHVDYEKVTSGNQGEPGVSRQVQAQNECARIRKYQGTRELATYDELDNYLRHGREAM